LYPEARRSGMGHDAARAHLDLENWLLTLLKD
jgi:hypothetical protein